MPDDDAVDWKPVERFRTHEYVLAQIEDQVIQRRLRPGDRLPGERQLAEALGVSRSAVREAFRVLESMGIISVGSGSGPSSGSTIDAHVSPALGNLLRLHLALASFSQRDLVEVRMQLEAWAVRELAERATAADFDALRNILSAMREPNLPYAAFNELDTAFHVTVSSISGNSLLALLMSGLRNAMQREMVAVFDTLPDPAAMVADLCDQHEAILHALERRDGARASELVTGHIAHFYSQSNG